MPGVRQRERGALRYTPFKRAKEATHEGAPPIDLVDGDQLADKLTELGLGLIKEMVERVRIDKNWFQNL